MAADLIEGVIAAGDVAVIHGDREFFDALSAIVGDRALCVVNADLDTRPVVEIKGDGEGGLQASFPRQPGRVPEGLNGEADPDRALIFYCGETARNAKHLAGLVPVILEAESPTLAKVVKVAGQSTTGLTVQLLDGRAVSWRL